MHRFSKAVCLVLVASLAMSGVAAAQGNAIQLRLADVQQKDWFYEGQAAAEREYSGGGAVAGGLLSGLGFGLIGWGIGYAIVSGMDADVPQHHVRNLSTSDREMFKDGYTKKVRKSRKGKFNLGAAIGTLAIVTLIATSGQ